MPYVDLLGHPSYHEIHNDGWPVLVLQTAATARSRTSVRSATAWAGSYRVLAPERVGHGRTADRGRPLSYAGALAYLDAVGLGSAHVVGFSDGAILGLLMALEHQSRVRSVVSISANLDPDGFVPDEDFAGDDSGDECPDRA